MSNEVTIPEHFPEITKEELIAADVRREKYTQMRDLQAREFNGAILARLEKEKEKAASEQGDGKKSGSEK